MPLPSGSVTFLFTDLEDSTRLWERHGSAMRDALVRHDAIMQDAIDAHGGSLVKHTGDGVCAVFPEAREAAAACLAAQRALALAGDGEVTLRSRMAIYTGVAELAGSDYRGTVLNRAARLMAAAHGGQVLVSQSAHAAIDGGLPEGVHVRDLGLRRLRDVPEPEQVFQLVADGLRSEFPPLRTLDMRKLVVPSPATPLIGREREIAVVERVMRGGATRLVTLTGPGGTGKSRLSIEIARRLVDDYADGAIFVPLAAIANAQAVPHAIAQALDVRESAGEDLAQALSAAVRDKNLLLVLDNFEQIVDAAPLVSTLLEAAPRLHVLATSRERLHLSSEHEHALAPMVQDEAVALFIARAQAIKPELRMDAGNARDIAEICGRLDGLPLAIELAAARVRVLPLSRIRSELDASLRFLVGGARDVPERHRTLRATIDWSYRLLDEREQALFRRFAIFVDGATLEAVEAVCGASANVDLALESLAAKSLVVQVEGEEPRFSMLETIREFASERLDAHEGRGDVALAHAGHFARLAEGATWRMHSPEQAAVLRRLDKEAGNLRAALECAASTPHRDIGLLLCRSLHQFWATRGWLDEGRRWCARMLEIPTVDKGAFERVATIHTMAVLAMSQNDYEVARPLFEQCIAHWREAGDLRRVSRVLSNLGIVLENLGELSKARSTYEESIALKEGLDDKVFLSVTLGNLANVVAAQGELDHAESLLNQAVSVERGLGGQHNLALCLCNLAGVLRRSGNLAKARRSAEEGIAILSQLNAKGTLATVLEEMGNLAMDEGAHDAARDAYVESLAMAAEIGDRRALAAALEGLAVLAVLDQQPEHTAKHLGAASRIRELIRTPLPSLDRPRIVFAIAQAKALLQDDERFDVAWRSGAKAGAADAAAFALKAAGR